MTGTTGRQRAQEDLIKDSIFNLPSLPEQKRIAEILSSLDDKIELNNQMNKTLEEIAQAIFKQWFVDFEFPNENGEPYKSSGGEMVESELGEIPKGWRVGKLGEIANISSGKRPSKKSEEKNKEFQIPLIGASKIMGYTDEILLEEKVLIIGRVGTHGIVQKFNEPIWASDNTLIIKAEAFEFVYRILNLVDYKSLNRGSTQPLITQTDMNNVAVLIADDRILRNYEKRIENLSRKIAENYKENEKLEQIRDELLPKLMSGDV